MAVASTIGFLSSEFAGSMQSIGYFEPNPTIAIATSGGADSMALLLLAKNWVTQNGGQIIALTVNHNLRKEAASEAQQVALWSKQLGIKHQILSWQHPAEIKSSIQENARAARYRLMLEYCNQNNILHLLTAHHADDQAETMFFRLARGSGLEGLSAMSAQNIVCGVRLLRPLLQVPKSQLVALLEENKQEWLTDPSNENSLYSRVHIRKQLAQVPDEQTIKQKANSVINSLGKFRKSLEAGLASQIAAMVEIHSAGYAILNLDKNHLSPQILSAVIQTISGDEHPPRSEKIENLYAILSNKELNSKRSLGGVIFEPISADKIVVYREANAMEEPCLVAIGTEFFWDKRFLVNWYGEKTLPEPVTIRALGSEGLAQIKRYSPQLLRNLPKSRIVRTFPSLWLLDELLAAPHINYMSKQATICNIKYNIQFRPAKALAGSGFFMNNLTQL